MKTYKKNGKHLTEPLPTTYTGSLYNALTDTQQEVLHQDLLRFSYPASNNRIY